MLAFEIIFVHKGVFSPFASTSQVR